MIDHEIEALIDHERERNPRITSQLENSSVWPIDRRTFIEWNLQVGRVMNKALSIKNEGNKAFADKDYRQALGIYYRAMAEISVVTPRPSFTGRLVSMLSRENDALGPLFSRLKIQQGVDHADKVAKLISSFMSVSILDIYAFHPQHRLSAEICSNASLAAKKLGLHKTAFDLVQVSWNCDKSYEKNFRRWKPCLKDMLKEMKENPSIDIDIPRQMSETLQHVGKSLEAAWKEHEEFDDDAFTVPMHAFMHGALLPSELCMWMQVQFEAVMKEMNQDVKESLRVDWAASLYMVASLVPVNRDESTTGRMSQYLFISAIWLYGPHSVMKRRPIHFSKADDVGGNQVDHGPMGVGTKNSEKHAECQIVETLRRIHASGDVHVDFIQVGQGLNYLADDRELAKRGISGFPYHEDTTVTLRTVGHGLTDDQLKIALSPSGFNPDTDIQGGALGPTPSQLVDHMSQFQEMCRAQMRSGQVDPQAVEMATQMEALGIPNPFKMNRR